jgi:hypothetical protein
MPVLLARGEEETRSKRPYDPIRLCRIDCTEDLSPLHLGHRRRGLDVGVARLGQRVPRLDERRVGQAEDLLDRDRRDRVVKVLLLPPSATVAAAAAAAAAVAALGAKRWLAPAAAAARAAAIAAAVLHAREVGTAPDAEALGEAERAHEQDGPDEHLDLFLLAHLVGRHGVVHMDRTPSPQGSS